MTRIHERALVLLPGWTQREVQSISLQGLREVLRGDDHPAAKQLCEDISKQISTGAYIVGEPLKRKKQQ